MATGMMPAYAEEVEAAIEEGIRLETLVSPVRIRYLETARREEIHVQTAVSPIKIESRGGWLVGIECIRNQLGDRDTSGHRKPVPVPGSEFHLALNTLIVAIGERPDSDGLAAQGLEVDRQDRLCADRKTLRTSRQGVFAGGDVVTGPNTVVDAIAAGKKAVEAAQFLGFPIPTLCHLEGLSPYGACQLCVVEIGRGGQGPAGLVLHLPRRAGTGGPHRLEAHAAGAGHGPGIAAGVLPPVQGDPGPGLGPGDPPTAVPAGVRGLHPVRPLCANVRGADDGPCDRLPWAGGEAEHRHAVRRPFRSLPAVRRLYGAIIVQANIEDARLGAQEYAIEKLGVQCVELKSLKLRIFVVPTGPVPVDPGLATRRRPFPSAPSGLAARRLRRRAARPEGADSRAVPLVPKPDSTGTREFERHSRVGMVTEESFAQRVEELRQAGAKYVFLKTGAYRPVDLARAVVFSPRYGIDLLTVDAAGGGTGMSPWRMMNEWGVPPVYLHSLLYQYAKRLADRGEYTRSS